MRSSCDFGRKDCFPVLHLEIWCGAVNPAVKVPSDVQNEDADSICTYLVRGKRSRSIPDPKAAMKKNFHFILLLSSLPQSKIAPLLNPLIPNTFTVSLTPEKQKKRKKNKNTASGLLEPLQFVLIHFCQDQTANSLTYRIRLLWSCLTEKKVLC